MLQLMAALSALLDAVARRPAFVLIPVSRIFMPFAYNATFVALTHDGPRTLIDTRICEPRFVARSPTLNLSSTVICVSNPMLTSARPASRFEQAAATSMRPGFSAGQ